MSEKTAAIRRFIEKNREAILRDTARLIAIDSVDGAPEENAPYGKAARRALDEALAIAEELGLGTGCCENRMGWAEIAGRDTRYLATITHVDVVPAGEGWDDDAFRLCRREGYLIGRGILDDKGPTVLCLYALRFLLEQGKELRYPIRALIGSSEETGMDDIDYYLAQNVPPVFCFSPDAEFPLCNGEKGILQGRFFASADTSDGEIVRISGGLVPNAVADSAVALVRSKRKFWPSADKISVRPEGDLTRIEASGIGGHASLPEHTVNANGILVQYLLETDVGNDAERAFLRLAAKLHTAYDGSGLGIKASDGKFTPLTAVGGVLGKENGRLFQSIDCRYPTSTSGEAILAALKEASLGVAEVEVSHDAPPFYMEATHPAVLACMDAYNEVTGEQAKPFTIGGGTYARKFPLAVSFGPEHRERPRPSFAGGLHSANEAFCEAEFFESLEIYIDALLRLEELEL